MTSKAGSQATTIPDELAELVGGKHKFRGFHGRRQLENTSLGIQGDGLFFLREEEGRPRRQYLFRVRVINGCVCLCFRDTWRSRKGQGVVEVAVPLALIQQGIANLIE